jgi:hypothetical protein
LPSGESAANPSSVRGWQPILSLATGTGYVRAGTVLVGLAPASAFSLVVGGHAVARSTSLGGLPVFAAASGEAGLRLTTFPFDGLLAGLTLALWASVALGFGVLEAIDQRVRRRHLPPVELP